MELDVRGRRVMLATHEAGRLAELARAQAARSSRARDLALVLERARAARPVVLQRGDERVVARLLRGRDDLSPGLEALRAAVTTS
ncbi:MAG TPA: hypothetical protein VGJ25_03770 [Gaiellaceae bacterium]